MADPEVSATTVVVADDDTLVRSVLRMALTRAGFDVVEAGDAPEAIAVTTERRPALAVLDINMPGGSVHETLPALRAVIPRLPVLILSGEVEAPAGLLCPECDFARKPIDLDDFLGRVSRLLSGTVDPS